jgi:prophage regulatory protein
MQTPVAFKSLLRFRQVKEIVPLSRSEIYRRIARGQFPKPIKLGERVVAFDADAIQDYVREMLAGGAINLSSKSAQS